MVCGGIKVNLMESGLRPRGGHQSCGVRQAQKQLCRVFLLW